MNKILSLQPLKNSNDLRSFRKFVDNCNVQLRSLNSLGVSSANYGKILCPMLLKFIPSDLLLDYNKLQQNGSGSDIQQLLLFLMQSLTAREQTYTMNKSSFELYDCRQETKSNFSREHRSHKQQNQKSFHTACELLTAPVKENKDKIKLSCIFWDSMTHNSNECKYVINLSSEERKNILLRKGACFNCLKVAKHLSRNCPMNKTKCEICSGLHHKFFCFKQQKREIESISTDLANQNTGEVFLQTLTVYIENGNSKQLIRAILDTGSQKSYISEYAAKFIGLKSIGKETITHGLFGGHKITEVHDKYLINLCSYDGKYSFNMEVNDQKNICLGISRINDSRVLQKLATLNVFISDSSANNKIYLFEKHSDEIHILLGCDIVGKLFTGEVKQLSEGLTAVNTHLGWTVMGKLSNESKFKSENSLLVHSLLTNREKISDLWELDSLGIKDPSEKRSKLELQVLALKHCENTILRDDEGRYIVSIPWTEGSGKFEDHYSLAKGRLEKTVKTLKFTGRLFDYDQVFVDWEKEGIIEKIAQDEPNKLLNYHSKQAPEHLEKAAEKLKDSMFVDNCVASVDSSEELKSFQRDSTELLTLGKFDLSGWRHSDIEPNFDFRDNRQESGPQEIQIMGSMKEDTFSISYREIDIERKFEAWKKQLMEIQNIRFPENYRISILKMRTCHYDFFVMQRNHPMIDMTFIYLLYFLPIIQLSKLALIISTHS
ncbi:integrase catalytic domain-containing protein [Trichonephila clavata]|uniref:Integrase catalytic domain-containing protein n=1 Tax=Trichonephila clavata TaxID=2740835 RepID=A0A8X6HU45_TRICU|nr:integrase catalytic domain-containing protein [Trichonephila clavata]